MGKRSDFNRRPQDAYDTPTEAVKPLIPHLPPDFTYWEPCGGTGALERALYLLTDTGAYCAWLTDVKPRSVHVREMDAFYGVELLDDFEAAEYIITNPPWTRQILHPMIEHFSDMRPTWLLFDADWIHTKQAAPYLWRLQKIVSAGRVSWMQNGTSGKDNCAWYLFDAKNTSQTRFFGRAA